MNKLLPIITGLALAIAGLAVSASAYEPSLDINKDGIEQASKAKKHKHKHKRRHYRDDRYDEHYDHGYYHHHRHPKHHRHHKHHKRGTYIVIN